MLHLSTSTAHSWSLWVGWHLWTLRCCLSKTQTANQRACYCSCYSLRVTASWWWWRTGERERCTGTTRSPSHKWKTELYASFTAQPKPSEWKSVVQFNDPLNVCVKLQFWISYEWVWHVCYTLGISSNKILLSFQSFGRHFFLKRFIIELINEI